MLKYKLTYFVRGNIEAKNVIVTETLPDGATLDTTLSDPRWVCVSTLCTINLGDLPVGSSADIAFVVRLPVDFNQPPICFSNRATINHTSAIPDPTPENNHAELQLGSCGGNATICPQPCKPCPACNCKKPACYCPADEPLICPDPTYPEVELICPEPICNCPTNSSCPKCPTLDCKCPAKCADCPSPDECPCKETITVNLPGLKCTDDYCEFSGGQSEGHYKRDSVTYTN
jgi:hypothetical protein